MDSFIVTDIGYGDAGKGTTVDYLARQVPSSVTVRHSGGSQAAHNVVTPGGRHHTFAQFGSGSFAPGSRTHLSRFMMINPSYMLAEAGNLFDAGVPDIMARTTVDRDAPVLTPWHAWGSQLREIARGTVPHGSCGVGIGELQMDLLDHTRAELVLRAGDIADDRSLRVRLRMLASAKIRQYRLEIQGVHGPEADNIFDAMANPALIDNLLEDYAMWRRSGLRVVDGSYLGDLASDADRLIFEGSQGVLLDEWHGFHPYTTWSTTTSENAETLLSEIGFSDPVTRLGVTRAYATRHGNGPFVTEDPSLEADLREAHNGYGRWMGGFRYGHLDLVALQYAVQATGGIDGLVVTGLDRADSWRYCTGYRLDDLGPGAVRFAYDASGQVARITPAIKGDLDRQSELTDMLAQCRPVYALDAVNDRDLLRVLETTLGAPAVLASYGPTADHKRVPVAV